MMVKLKICLPWLVGLSRSTRPVDIFLELAMLTFFKQVAGEEAYWPP